MRSKAYPEARSTPIKEEVKERSGPGHLLSGQEENNHGFCRKRSARSPNLASSFYGYLLPPWPLRAALQTCTRRDGDPKLKCLPAVRLRITQLFVPSFSRTSYPILSCFFRCVRVGKDGGPFVLSAFAEMLGTVARKMKPFISEGLDALWAHQSPRDLPRGGGHSLARC